jgi:hypothetical protein
MHSHQPIEMEMFIGIIRIVIAVSIGTALASILQYKGWIKYISFIVKPLFKFGRLPSICGSAFLTALFSNQAAAAMLADAKREDKITRKEMIAGGIINSFPAHMSHLTRILLIIIPLLGSIALIYILISFLIDLIRTLIVFLYTRKTAHPDYKDFTYIDANNECLSWSEIWFKTLKRILRILKRIGFVYVPLYIIVTYISYAGLFRTLNKYIPKAFENVLSPEVFTILVTKIGGLIASASVAMGMLQSNKILPIQVLFALLLGNMLTIPFNSIRRNLPIALGIYPGKDGLWVVLILGTIRFVFTLIVVIILFCMLIHLKQ